MPRNKPPKTFEDLSREEQSALLFHLRQLRLRDTDAYVAWCGEHGFGPQLMKPAHQRRKELEHREALGAKKAMARSRTARKNPRLMLDRIYGGEVEPDDLAPEYRIVAELLGSFGKRKAASWARFCDLFGVAHAKTKLVSARPVIEEYPHDPHNTFVGGLASLATHHAAWLRPLEDWKPDSKNARRQFGSLARHLLAKYPVPAFFDSVWFRRSRTQNWFLHVAAGGNIRKAERLFFPMTKRMAHEFMQAPPTYTLEQALRWGQIHALEGNRRMVDAVCGTRLGMRFEHDEFWLSVLRFFVRNPFLDTMHYGPIVDYIQHHKYEEQQVFVRPGVIEQQGPPHPGFTMRGRSVDALLRQVQAWHVQLGREQRAGPAQWRASGISGLDLVEGTRASRNMRRWTVTELLDRDALIAEGRAMRHCIASYAHSCAVGHSSVWSLQCETASGRARVLTIEVRPKSRLVAEARGKYNELPTQQAMRILRRWCEQEGLGLAAYVQTD